MSRRRIVLLILVGLLLLVVAAGAILWNQFGLTSDIQRAVAGAVNDYRFNLVGYEVDAVSGKLYDWWSRPGSRLTEEEQVQLVRDYHWRALRIGWLENDIERIYADPDIDDPEVASEALRQELQALKRVQDEIQPLVEAIIERQISDKLADLGIETFGVVWPPVRFNFSDLPQYLIVSPRDRIALEAGIHLRPDLDLSQVETLEDEVAQKFDRSTLIEGLGGLGVWPTMVLDDSSLSWILSTVAHEWVHNYLAFQPLGWHMFDSGEMDTINETVATIVGDEVGDTVAYELYGIPLPPPEEFAEELPEPDPEHFDFRTEMRRTRLKVDELLAEGKVDEAEAYMEERRRLFVENGYSIRKLNQAYFAFHGTYATRAAASDPIGPKLQELRKLTPDLKTFLYLVKDIRQPEDLDVLLEEWRSPEGGQALPEPVPE